MTVYTNTDSVRRVWAGLVTADGSTVDLEPGETVDLDNDHLDDPWLKPAEAASPSPSPTTPDPASTPPDPPDAATDQPAPPVAAGS